MASNGKLTVQIPEQSGRMEAYESADERAIQEWENEGGALAPLIEDIEPLQRVTDTANLLVGRFSTTSLPPRPRLSLSAPNLLA